MAMMHGQTVAGRSRRPPHRGLHQCPRADHPESYRRPLPLRALPHRAHHRPRPGHGVTRAEMAAFLIRAYP